MTDKTAHIVELLASRICHDIISPVGAVNNGVELMEEMGPEGLEDGLELIGYSASQAAAKLAAFRMAYGAGGKDPNIKPEDVQKLFGELIRAEGKISQAWDPFGNLGPNHDKAPLPAGYCKMLMCALMLAMEALPKGGYISVRPTMGDDKGHSLIIAEGEGATIRDGVDDALNQRLEPEDLDPRLVHPYAISVLAESYGYNVAIKNQDEGRIEFLMTCPKADDKSDDGADDVAETETGEET